MKASNGQYGEPTFRLDAEAMLSIFLYASFDKYEQVWKYQVATVSFLRGKSSNGDVSFGALNSLLIID